MDDVQGLLRTTLDEIDKLLQTKTVVGEPITIDGNTIIPLVAVGFGFGGGGGSGKGPKETGEGTGGGTGAGGGVKPVAVIIVNPQGVKVEPIKGAFASFGDKLGDVMMKMMEKRGEKGDKGEKKPEGQ